jgi:hypothetical protein
MAVRWGQLNYLRHTTVLIAWLLALKAFSLPGKYDKQAALIPRHSGIYCVNFSASVPSR